MLVQVEHKMLVFNIWYVLFLNLILLQLEALIHPFFDELRDPNTRLPNGRYLPPLFNFKSHGTCLLNERVTTLSVLPEY